MAPPSLWGPDPIPLPPRFTQLKRTLARDPAALTASFHRLISALRAETDHIDALGAHLIPSLEYTSLGDPAQTARFGESLRRYGVGVVRRVIPASELDASVEDTLAYLDARRSNFYATKQDPTCFDCFWTPAQVRCRAHPAVLSAQRFLMGLWAPSPHIAPDRPVAYADRIRLHGLDYSGTSTPREPRPAPPLAPQSADDWITALQSSAGIIAQVDNGSLERWEHDGYGDTYASIFAGDWEAYDPWDSGCRASATTDLYNGYGACSIFRMYQGLLALSALEPGTLRLLPSPKLATAYYLLRPFFSPRTPPPESRSGPDWDAYLDPRNWELAPPDATIHGAVPGHAQRITERWHPHLFLRNSLITLPTLQAGDYICWHPDLPYHISSSGAEERSLLVYLPAAPLTQTNALYLARQRKAFKKGGPGPDFDGLGRKAEDTDAMPGVDDIMDAGGHEAVAAMGLAPWTEGANTDVVNVANQILFPD